MVCLGISSNLCQDDYNEENIAYWLVVGKKHIAQVGDGWWFSFQLIGLAVFALLMASFVAFEALLSYWFLVLGFLLMLKKNPTRTFGGNMKLTKTEKVE